MLGTRFGNPLAEGPSPLQADPSAMVQRRLGRWRSCGSPSKLPSLGNKLFERVARGGLISTLAQPHRMRGCRRTPATANVVAGFESPARLWSSLVPGC